MAYVTRDQALRAATRRGARSIQLAEADLRKAAAAPMSSNFDVFLSHSLEDATVILGLMQLLEEDGLRVYVDWVIDPHLDRGTVDARTAARLRERMRHCGYLMFASSRASSTSRWMPWELGFFDGFRPGRVGILPIVTSPWDGFVGQEYLGLYPKVDLQQFQSGRTRFAAPHGSGTRSLETLARSSG